MNKTCEMAVLHNEVAAVGREQLCLWPRSISAGTHLHDSQLRSTCMRISEAHACIPQQAHAPAKSKDVPLAVKGNIDLCKTYISLTSVARGCVGKAQPEFPVIKHQSALQVVMPCRFCTAKSNRADTVEQADLCRGRPCSSSSAIHGSLVR